MARPGAPVSGTPPADLWPDSSPFRSLFQARSAARRGSDTARGDSEKASASSQREKKAGTASSSSSIQIAATGATTGRSRAPGIMTTCDGRARAASHDAAALRNLQRMDPHFAQSSTAPATTKPGASNPTSSSNSQGSSGGGARGVAMVPEYIPSTQRSPSRDRRRRVPRGILPRSRACVGNVYWAARDAIWRQWLLFAGTWGLGVMETWEIVPSGVCVCVCVHAKARRTMLASCRVPL